MKTARILVVADEPAFALEIRALVMHLGCQEPLAASTVQEATNALAHGPDIILIDMGLQNSERGGITAAARIWEQSKTPIIFLCRSLDTETMRRALTQLPSGYLRFMLTPISEGRLRAELEDALKEAREGSQA